jgi:hypothetical protein
MEPLREYKKPELIPLDNLVENLRLTEGLGFSCSDGSGDVNGCSAGNGASTSCGDGTIVSM